MAVSVSRELEGRGIIQGLGQRRERKGGVSKKGRGSIIIQGYTILLTKHKK